MSTLDTVTPLISLPWLDASGKPLSVKSLPGLHPEVLNTLECAYPDIVSPAPRELLCTCCGLADTSEASVSAWVPSPTTRCPPMAPPDLR